jgi:DNA-binding LacI/PurR family transcriptional regulator
MLIVMNLPNKRVRLIDVAERAEVSRSAAGHVLLGTGANSIRVSDSTAERIRHAAKKLGYHPNRAAQQLRGVSTQTLGILMDTVNAPVMNDRLAAIEKEASTRGYRLLIGQLHGNIKDLEGYLGDFGSRGVDSIFCLFDVTLGRAERLMPILGNRNDIVLHGKPLVSEGYCVRVDTAFAIDSLVTHLLKQGHRRIGLQLEGTTDELMSARREAYLSAMHTNSIKVDENLIWTNTTESVDPTTESIRDGIDSLVVASHADAIIASNDLWAAGIIQGLKARGHKVPKDVAVTGYDNLHLSTIIDPQLTTIDQQHALYAKAAVNLMIAAAFNPEQIPSSQRTVVIPPKLIVRESA